MPATLAPRRGTAFGGRFLHTIQSPIKPGFYSVFVRDVDKVAILAFSRAEDAAYVTTKLDADDSREVRCINGNYSLAEIIDPYALVPTTDYFVMKYDSYHLLDTLYQYNCSLLVCEERPTESDLLYTGRMFDKEMPTTDRIKFLQTLYDT